jgi:bacillolysin
VVFDPRTSDQSLYAGAFTANNLDKISNGLGCLSKPSVTDDGSFVYFVGKDNHIYRIDLVKKTAPVKLSDAPSWRNVAISKDGKLLAALASKIDKYIYVFNLTNNKNTRFLLYNPTYTKGINTGEVLYADSFEWDYSGEFLFYDAFNKAKSNFKDIEFWDVGILKAWDVVKKDFATGTVEKLFTNLEVGDNVGNPTIAKTNLDIMAFDYFSENDDAYYVINVDLGKSSNNVKVVETNNDIGFPDFSKADKTLVFNSLSGTQNVVKGIALGSDKISPVGKSSILYRDAKWAVWYAAGTRVLPTKEAQEISVSTITDKQPRAIFDILASTSSKLALNYSVVSGDASLNGRSVTLGTKPGKVVIRVFQIGDSKFSPTSADVTFCIIPPTPSLTDNGTFVSAAGGSLYQFFVNNSPVGGQTTTTTFKKDFPGSYSVRNVTADGCASASSNSIGVAALATEPTLEAKVNVFPNPVLDFLQVEVSKEEKFESLEIFDALGKGLLKSSDENVNVSGLQSGKYVLKVKTDKNQYALKIVKK